MILKRFTGLLGSLAILVTCLAGGTIPASANQQNAEGIYTDNIKYISHLQLLGDGVGARVIGHYLYATSSKDLEIYDISDPVNPVEVSSLTLNVEFENEQVPTNGKILGISNSLPCTTDTTTPTAVTGSCLTIYDVTDKANPKLLTVVDGAGDHTMACVFDCQFMYGSSGHIVNLTHVTKDGKAEIIGNWQTGLPGKSCHHVNEVSPGIILTATQPVMLLSVRPEDGGNILHPKLLATGTNIDGRFIHSGQWAQHGADRIALIGGETNFKAQCSPTNGAFMTWDASQVYRDGAWQAGTTFKMIDEYRVNNGLPTNGDYPVGILGCSVHWFEEQPQFHNGGLVALAAYENGTRFLQITPDGKIHEQGWFVPYHGSTSAPHWAPDGKTVYLVDYQRGLDIVQWLGPTYVPTSGTAGASTTPAPSPSAAAPSAAAKAPLPNTPAGPGLAWAGLLLAAAGAAAFALRKSSART